MDVLVNKMFLPGIEPCFLGLSSRSISSSYHLRSPDSCLTVNGLTSPKILIVEAFLLILAMTGKLCFSSNESSVSAILKTSETIVS